MHLAAESHVDRSIEGPKAFIESNIIGTFNLLQSCLSYYKSSLDYKNNFRFHHISTDEVFGSLGKEGSFNEGTSYDPRSPYSASKAASDHLVRAWNETYKLPTVITNCSNNFGPYQFPEKLIPVAILKLMKGEKVPIYGDGENIRDWLFVEDHVNALLQVAEKGRISETYCIGGHGEKNNKEVVNLKKIGEIDLLELYRGPTLAFKDIAMQVIGNLYDYLEVAKDKTVNVVVATSGDTGSAAIAALSNRKNINLFVLHPHNKISNIQRKIMTTIGGTNIYNIAIEGSFDDCQKIVKELFNENSFRSKINMSGVNSINWVRIVCQIVYYFYSFFKLNKNNLSFSVPTGNFGDIFAGYVAKKMGLPINKLIVATNKNDILQRVINTGEYKPDTVKATITPSMDIQVASNFERLLYYILDESDTTVSYTHLTLPTKA